MVLPSEEHIHHYIMRLLLKVVCLILHYSTLHSWQPTPVLLPGKSHGWRSLVGCIPVGHKESGTTERLHFHFSLSCIGEGNVNPLQCSCLENPRGGGAWWAAVYGVAQSRTQLKRLSSSSSSSSSCCLIRSSQKVYNHILGFICRPWFPDILWVWSLSERHFLILALIATWKAGRRVLFLSLRSPDFFVSSSSLVYWVSLLTFSTVANRGRQHLPYSAWKSPRLSLSEVHILFPCSHSHGVTTFSATASQVAPFLWSPRTFSFPLSSQQQSPWGRHQGSAKSL